MNQMKHPFSAISPQAMPRIFAPMLAATLVFIIVMNWVALPLETDAAPYGIISFELAGNAADATRILSSWDENAQVHAAFSLGLDYLFLVVYSTTIGLACIWAARVLKSRMAWLAKGGIPLAWGLWLAALLDGIENTGLIWILFGNSAQFWAVLARWCAIIKFSLIFAGLCYVFLGLAFSLIDKAQ